MRMSLTTVLAIILFSTAYADDWPQWGGPNRDIVWREQGIVERLPDAELLPRVWSVGVGEGYSGPAVADGRVYVTDRIPSSQQERVLCVDAESGAQLWKHEYASRYTISYPAGPRTTPVVDGGRVYTIGAMGQMYCLDTGSGDVVWQKDFESDYGTKLPTWGMAASPLVDGDQLITLVGGKEGALIVSFDKATGKELWRSLEDADVGYCPPVIYEFGGRRQLIIWHPSGVSSLNPSDGKLIWKYDWNVRYGLCIPMPPYT